MRCSNTNQIRKLTMVVIVIFVREEPVAAVDNKTLVPYWISRRLDLSGTNNYQFF